MCTMLMCFALFRQFKSEKFSSRFFHYLSVKIKIKINSFLVKFIIEVQTFIT